MDICPSLLQCSLFAGLDYEQLDAFLTCIGAGTRRYEKNSLIIRTGEPLSHVLLVAAGRIKIFHERRAAGESSVETLGPSGLFGMAYAIRHARCIVTVRALTDCTVLFLRYDRMTALCRRSCPVHRRVMDNLLPALAEKVLLQAQKIEYLHLRSLRAKLAAYLVDTGRSRNAFAFSIPLNRSQLAEYLGASRASMTRELSAMRQEGLVDFEGRQFRLLDPEGLSRCAEE